MKGYVTLPYEFIYAILTWFSHVMFSWCSG